MNAGYNFMFMFLHFIHSTINTLIVLFIFFKTPQGLVTLFSVSSFVCLFDRSLMWKAQEKRMH